MSYRVTSFDLTLALLQYYRKRGWVCVDEFRGADVIIDTGKDIIEVEIKVTKSDLVNGERAKLGKHQAYKQGWQYNLLRPNKFLFCVPEKLVDVALNWSREINGFYGVIGFDSEGLERLIETNSAIWWMNKNYFLRVAKSAKRLHENYNDKLHWDIAQRTSAKIAALFMVQFKKNLNLDSESEAKK